MLSYPPILSEWTVQRGHDTNCRVQYEEGYQGERDHQGEPLGFVCAL